MKKEQLINGAIGLLGVLFVVYLFLNTTQYNHYDWSETYEKESTTPYGNYLLFELLKKQRETEGFESLAEPIGVSLSDSSLTNTNYIFKGLQHYHNRLDREALLSYVERGNNAFLISNGSPFDIIYESTSKMDGTIMSFSDTAVFTMNLISDSLDIDSIGFKYIVDWKTELYDWKYMSVWSQEEEDYDWNQSFTELGAYTSDDINFARFNHGEGFIYVHTVPILFSNFYLREEKGLKYAETVFKHLNDGEIFWDDFNHRPNLDSPEAKSNPLMYILSQPALKWGWYICVFMGILYLFLFTRRRERIVPVLDSNSNTSIEFVETIASLYFQPNGNLKILRHKRTLFLTYLRNHYFISTNTLDEEFIKVVSLKSGISTDKIEQILKEGKRLEFINQVSDEMLIAYHKQTTYFYNNCK